MIIFAYMLALVALAPLLLYLFGFLRDPFHPLLFWGVLSFSVAALPVIRYENELVRFLPEDLYTKYLQFSALCVLAAYFGWYLGRGFVTKHYDNAISIIFNNGILFFWGVFCSVFSVVMFFWTYQQWEVTGYLRDLGMLWITAAILLLQVIIYSSNLVYRIWAVPFLLLSFVPPINRFLVYGQRGDTFRIAVIVMLVFFCIKKRPVKPIFLITALIFAGMMATIQMTRDMVTSGEYPNRVSALIHVVPRFFESRPFETNAESINTGTEVVFGAAGMEACAQTGRFGYGTGPTTGLIGRFLPKDLFNKASIQTAIPHAGYDTMAIKEATGLRIAYGAAPTGFAHTFFELGWFGWIFWIPMAMGFRIFWDRAIKLDDFRAQGYLAGYFIAILYAVTQDIITAEVNVVYVLLPLCLIYRIANRNQLAVTNQARE